MSNDPYEHEDQTQLHSVYSVINTVITSVLGEDTRLQQLVCVVHSAQPT
jgi:hypothetical protein